MDDARAFGKRLREVRIWRGLNLREAAGLSFSVWGQVERGERAVTNCMTQLHLAGRRLRGFVLDGPEISGHCTDGSWFTTGLHPDHDGLYPVAQGGPQRLWDTVESSYYTWRHLGEPEVEHFGVTAPDDTALQYVWFDHPDSRHRWPLPL